MQFQQFGPVDKVKGILPIYEAKPISSLTSRAWRQTSQIMKSD
jgi:hypothetical protein